MPWHEAFTPLRMALKTNNTPTIVLLRVIYKCLDDCGQGRKYDQGRLVTAIRTRWSRQIHRIKLLTANYVDAGSVYICHGTWHSDYCYKPCNHRVECEESGNKISVSYRRVEPGV